MEDYGGLCTWNDEDLDKPDQPVHKDQFSWDHLGLPPPEKPPSARLDKPADNLPLHTAYGRPLIKKPPPLNGHHNGDPGIQALKRRGFMNHGST